jgi:hypothetical protein
VRLSHRLFDFVLLKTGLLRHHDSVLIGVDPSHRYLVQEMSLKKFRRTILSRLFPILERMGFHLTRVTYNYPIPDTRFLENNLWEKKSELLGISINEKGQINLLTIFSSKFKDEYTSLPTEKTSVPHQYYSNNGTFSCIDGSILYCMIRYFKPNRIIEIGSGYSTLLSAQAILKNRENDEKYECELTAIEPYPSDILRKGFPGLSKLLTDKVQKIPLSQFDQLEENDILFIDSSHVLSIGSDVQYEFLEILPRLKKGVIVHVHDIFFPLEYPKEWVLKEQRFWSEQYLLQAFLMFNDSFQVLYAGAYMIMNHPDKVEAFMNSRIKTPYMSGSFWMQKKK